MAGIHKCAAGLHKYVAGVHKYKAGLHNAEHNINSLRETVANNCKIHDYGRYMSMWQGYISM